MADEALKMTYSAILRDKDNQKIVRVQFERTGAKGAEIAEVVLPECRVVSQNGYSDEEIAGLETYVRNNMDDIMSRAKVISNPLKWL